MLVLVLAVSSGCCNLDTVPNHDRVVLKMASDGALEWTMVINHGYGFDDPTGDLAELPDGGLAIAGQTSDRRNGPPRPVVVRLSPDGAVLWERFVADGSDVAEAVVSAGDGGTVVLTGNGNAVRVDPDGRTLWSRATGIPEARALAPTADGGYLTGGRITYEIPVNDTAGPGTVVRLPVITTETGAVGPVLAEVASRPTTPQIAQVPRRFDHVRKAMVVKLAADGAIEWERQYDDGGLTNILSLAEGPADAGFLLVGEGASSPNDSFSNPLLALSIDREGMPGPVTLLHEPASFSWSVRIRPEADGYRVLSQPIRISQENYFRGAEDALLAPDGHENERRTIRASLAVSWTAGGGYASVGIPSDGGSAPVCGWRGACSYLLRTFDRQGAVVSDRPISDVAEAPFDQVLKLIQTADGGYAVLGQRQNL